MPPVVVDLHRAGDPRDVIHEAVQRLVEGELVGLATETSYLTVAAATRPAAVQRLSSLQSSQAPATLVLPSAGNAWDYVSNHSRLVDRMINRCWPGPVVLQFAEEAGRGLSSALAPEVQARIAANGELRLRVPGEAAFLDVLRLLPGPAVVGAENTGEEVHTSASQLIAQCGDALSLVIDTGASRYGQRATTVRLHGNQWECAEPGIVNDRTIARLASEVYVFVCTGNTCRSPMAEALFRKMLADRLQCSEEDLTSRGFTVLSAGLSAGAGMPANPEAVDVLAREGIDLTPHGSQAVTEQMLLWADHILAMTGGHLDSILESFPEIGGRARMLSSEGDDVADPIGNGPEEYRRCRDQIVGYLHGLMSEIEST